MSSKSEKDKKNKIKELTLYGFHAAVSPSGLGKQICPGVIPQPERAII